MPSKQAYRLIWRGSQVEKRVADAVKAGIDETMEACVAMAKELAPVDTGALREDISFRPAEDSGSRTVGRWGNWEVPYAIFQEEGTVHNKAVHYLKRAMDFEYPYTNDRIKAHLAGAHRRWKT